MDTPARALMKKSITVYMMKGQETTYADDIDLVCDYAYVKLPIKTASHNRPMSRPASFYVRLRVPNDIAYETDSPTQLTTEILKFGIAYEVDLRDNGYVYSQVDNGYMAFSFQCETRAEASAVERIIRAQFEDVAVLNSFEYLDVSGVAARLGHKYDTNTYENYVTVGRALFVHMVETAKLVFPGKYRGQFGVKYQVRRTGACRKLTGSWETIGGSLATEYMYRTPSVTWTPEHEDSSLTELVSMATIDSPCDGHANHLIAERQSSNHREHSWRGTPFKEITFDGNRSSDTDTAGQALRYYATELWRVAPERVDERFYSEYVSDQVSYEKYCCAKRFILAYSHAITTQTLKEKLSEIMLCNDSNKTRLKQHYMKLIAGQTFMDTLLSREQIQELRSGRLTIDIGAVEDACARFKSQFDPSELKATLRMFDLSESASDFIAARKIAKLALGVELQRQSKRSNLAAFKRIDVDVLELLAMNKRYNPEILAPLHAV
jgi:hypothetical protein